MIRDAATQAQVDAADPGLSTWLSANAGSGKTRVLTDRVARLLLEGTDPQNVLCLTYTKAAASEMQNRLFKRLGEWAMMPNDDLADALQVLGVSGVLDGTRLRDARRLFARAIETPGGLRIQTIHSFCAGLLRRFPLEAGISPQFREMEDRAAEMLRAEVTDELSLSAPEVVRDLFRYVTDEDGLDGLLKEVVSLRQAIAAGETDWRAILGLAEGVDEERLLASVGTAADRAMLAEVATLAAGGSSNDTRLAAKIEALPGMFTLDDLPALEAMLTFGSGAKAGEAKGAAILTKASQAKSPALAEALDDLAERVVEARADRLALAALRRTEALHKFAMPFLALYEARKQAGGWLDFDDQIALASRLLNDPQVAAWVLFRLDGGIDHILVDEAQDTSPEQWRVIRALAQEFSAGEGADPDRQRTIFVVGDKKQSIYSFQGADPEEFDRMCAHFEAELGNVGLPFRARELAHSFRSSSAVLRAVDATFGRDDTGVGVTNHIAFKDQMPGRVDLWPLLAREKPEEEQETHWYDPVDKPSAQDPKIVLAEAIAARIRAMLDAGETIPEEIGHTGEYRRRPIHEGDILILVQGRGTGALVSLFGEIISACKRADLAVAGADRLKVGAELAVKDIAATLRFLALPEDDLSLACALRSPLFGLSEAELYALAQPRGKKHLWQALRDTEAHPEVRATIDDLRKQADFLRPYDLINRILTRHDGRRRLLARLGAEAEDGIDALLAQALAYEQTDVPGLTGFLEWMQTDDLTIKRQSESAGRRIRVMSVHGAKGLEAPIVILPDTDKKTTNVRNRLYSAGSATFLGPPAAELPDVLRVERERLKEVEERERRRLLYVAMTRAQSWLIVCGQGSAGKEGDSWHGLVENGMGHVGAADHDTPTGPGLRFETGDWAAGDLAEAQPPAPSPERMSPLGIAPPTGARQRTRSPSELGGAKIVPGESTPDDEGIAKARGTLIHRLLEYLPAVPEAERRATGLALAAAHQGDTALFPGERRAMVEDVLGLLASPALAPLFAPGTLAEVDLTADVDGLGRMHGAIDRLIVAGDVITAVDYKSNRLVPDTAEQVPEGLLRQMAAYRAMLRVIWPASQIDIAILWTTTGALMHLPAALTDAALARATDAHQPVTSA